MTKISVLISFLALSSLFPCSAQLTYQPDKISREYVNLYSIEDSLIKSRYRVKNVSVAGERCYTFLGSYSDWTNINKYIWVRFQGKLDEELANYLYRVTETNEQMTEVEIAVHKFQHKQYLFFNPKGCFYRFKYELFFHQDGEKYSYFFEDTIKVKDVKSSSQVLGHIKASLTELLQNTSKSDFVKSVES